MKKESNNKGEERVCVCIYHTKHENNDRDRTDAQYIAYCKTNHTKVKWMKKDKWTLSSWLLFKNIEIDVDTEIATELGIEEKEMCECDILSWDDECVDKKI